MIESQSLAIVITLGTTAFLYSLSLALIFPLVRAHRHLQNRWAQYGRSAIEKWDKRMNRLEETRLRSLSQQSRLKSFLMHPYPSFKMIEYLFYRSGVFPSIKAHLVFQVLSIVFATEGFYIILKYSLTHSLCLGLLTSITLHFFYLRIKEHAWKKSFLKIFPISLDIINRGLKTGMTLGRGIAMVSEEVEDPVGHEFNYMASQLQIGITPDDALTESAARIGINEFRFFALALIIQREMGGSLADILGKLSEVIRERDRFRQKVKTLSAEGRATAVIVGSLPFFLGIAVELINPGYTKFFFVDPKGKLMLWICGGLTLVGFFILMRMMKVED